MAVVVVTIPLMRRNGAEQRDRLIGSWQGGRPNQAYQQSSGREPKHTQLTQRVNGREFSGGNIG